MHTCDDESTTLSIKNNMNDIKQTQTTIRTQNTSPDTCDGWAWKRMPAIGAPPPLDLGDLYAESGQTWKGSFSAVSKPNFASKYALESSRRDLHNALLCTVLESIIEKWGTFFNLKIFVKNCWIFSYFFPKFRKFCQNVAEFSPNLTNCFRSNVLLFFIFFLQKFTIFFKEKIWF